MLRKKFFRDGFVVEKNVLDKENQNLILDVISDNLKKFEKYIGYKNINRKSWKSSKFTNKLLKFKNKYKENFSFYYDTIQGNALLRKISSDMFFILKQKIFMLKGTDQIDTLLMVF